MQRFMLNSHNVPQRYWETNVIPLLQKWHRLFDMIEAADDVPVYSGDPEKIQEKIALQDECIHQLGRIYFDYQLAIQSLWRDRIDQQNETKEAIKTRNRINDWNARLKREEDLLVGWKQSTGKKKRKK